MNSVPRLLLLVPDVFCADRLAFAVDALVCGQPGFRPRSFVINPSREAAPRSQVPVEGFLHDFPAVFSHHQRENIGHRYSLSSQTAGQALKFEM